MENPEIVESKNKSQITKEGEVELHLARNLWEIKDDYF